MMSNILSILIFFPLVAALFILIFFKGGKSSMWAAFVASVIEFFSHYPADDKF